MSLCDAASIRAQRLGSSDVWCVFDCAGLREVYEARSGTNTARDQYRGVAGMACGHPVGELSHWKGVAFANAERHGVYSALLARANDRAAPIFEGQMGFEKQLGVSLGNVRGSFR